ncbi:stage II sporulation protein M [Limnochorda pilosa]|uniref:Stage II sporulation protein M n=1 Tax=Limnochorda pilosa TaxID=1555112 RepID=A0A0K2SKA8_LIMPI|nr:stage II sporulation protein M [Limnochorda pilosa]BAS27548.1 stage II sporulation protein M [Limnochorda pilosa]
MRRSVPRPAPGRYRLWILFAAGVLLSALVAGILGAAALPEAVRRQVESSLVLPEGPPPAGPGLLPAALRRNLVESAGLAWLLGLSLAGLPLIWVVLFWRGFELGFAAAFVWGWAGNGRWTALLALVPHNLLALPALCLLAVATARFSAALLRSLLQGRPPPRARLLADGLTAIAATLVLTGASYVEAYVTPQVVALSLRLLP